MLILLSLGKLYQEKLPWARNKLIFQVLFQFSNKNENSIENMVFQRLHETGISKQNHCFCYAGIRSN